MAKRATATGVSFNPVVLEYLNEVTDDPGSDDFGRSRSFIVNQAIAQYAESKGRILKIRRVKPGRPKKKV